MIGKTLTPGCSTSATVVLFYFYLFIATSSVFQSGIQIAEAFPWIAGHCSSGDLSGRYSGHGETGGGPLSNGSLQVKFDSIPLQTWTSLNINANQEYTVTLDFTASNSNFFFRGLLFRLSGKNGEDVEETFTVGSDGNVVSKSCDVLTSAISHNNSNDKTSVEFNFEYTKSASADLLLEVTVVRERAADNWFYSSYSLQIGGANTTSQPTAAPVVPITSPPTAAPVVPITSPPTAAPVVPITSPPTASPVVPITSPPTAAPVVPITSPPTASPVVSTLTPSEVKTTAPSEEPSSCNDSPLRFRTFKPAPDGTKIWRDCIWVANKSTNLRCSWEGVSTMCPFTCGTCDSCVDSSTRFKVILDERKITRGCDWVGNRATLQRCKASGVSDTCRETCGTC